MPGANHPLLGQQLQRARPASGSEHATATSNASSHPVSLRSAPTRGASLNAASNPCSTNRRLVRYTVDVPTPTVAATIASPWPCSAASSICARLTRRTRALPALVSSCNCMRSSSSSATMYRMCITASIMVMETVDHGTLTMSLPVSSPAPYTERQGQYLAFIHAYTKVNGRAPAQADMQRFFAVTAPSVHQMLLPLERRGFLRRTPGRAGLSKSSSLPRTFQTRDERPYSIDHNLCAEVLGEIAVVRSREAPHASAGVWSSGDFMNCAMGSRDWCGARAGAAPARRRYCPHLLRIHVGQRAEEDTDAGDLVAVNRGTEVELAARAPRRG